MNKISDPLLERKGITLYIKRDDLLHPEISGNKFRKLKHNIELARMQGHDTLLTFGGAYSNQIYAVAAAGRKYGFRTIGIIRGEKHNSLNPTLAFARDRGMVLHYIDRDQYRHKKNPSFMQTLEQRFGRCYVVPEGGSNNSGVKGCVEIVTEIREDYDVITCCCGTGATLAGIVAGLDGDKQAIGFPVLKGGAFLNQEVRSFIHQYNGKFYLNWHLETDYHMGGYAKYTSDLIQFINGFREAHQIQLDPVYTGKMFFGLFDLIRQDRFRPGTRIIALHSGGIQGIKGFNQRFGNLIDV